MEIILASTSQRRRELMELMGLDFKIIPANADENIEKGLPPEEYVMKLAQKKAQAVFESHKNACVIGADTIVVLDGEIIGKPKDKQAAFDTLSRLSGRTHNVFTGICVITKDEVQIDYDRTAVTFENLTPEDIIAYIDSGDPMDKAGAYGVQGPFCVNVAWLEGSYFNVMGLPVHKVNKMIRKAAHGQ